MANYTPIWLLQLCRYCLRVNDITGFCPAFMKMMLAYIRQSLLTSPYHICGAATTLGLWGNNASWKQWPPCIISVSPTTAWGMWLWPVRNCNCTSHRCWKQHWGGLIRPDKDAKPLCAVFWEENPLTFSTDKKGNQLKFACKHSLSCALPMW